MEEGKIRPARTLSEAKLAVNKKILEHYAKAETASEDSQDSLVQGVKMFETNM